MALIGASDLEQCGHRIGTHAFEPGKTSRCRTRSCYSYGHIEVLGQPGLEKHVCECHEVVRKERERLLPDLKAM
jgi:hypothetical protein